MLETLVASSKGGEDIHTTSSPQAEHMGQGHVAVYAGHLSGRFVTIDMPETWKNLEVTSIYIYDICVP